MSIGRMPGLRAFLAVLLMLGAALAVRDGMVRTFETSQPDLAVRFWPESGTALAMLALQQTTEAGGVVDVQGRGPIARSMAQIPSAGLPLALAALDASAAGDLDRATRLMELARHRSPRLAMVRGWLINEYARTGRYAEALGEAGPVMRLSADSREQVYALISAIAERPEGAVAVQAALTKNPDWRRPYLQWREARQQADAGLSAAAR